MPAVGDALKTVESAVRALIPLLVASVAVLVVAAGALGAGSVDFVVLVRAVGYTIGCAIASATVSSALDTNSRAMELCKRTELKSVHLWATMKMAWRRNIHGGENRKSGERGDLHFGCVSGIQSSSLE